MMKKIIAVITLFVSFTFWTSTVSARGELIYDITDMVISDTAVVFKGWAEINEYHNYGGSSTTIKIFAMKKGDTNEGNWVSANITYNSQYDTALYQANCMRYSGVGQPCVESHDQATCNPSKLNSTSSCKYDNVGFTATLMLDKLYEELGEDDEITFKIRVSNTGGVTQTEELGVFSGNCNVSNGETVSGSKFSVTVSELANSGKIVTNDARVIQNEAGAYARGSSFKWIGNAVYQIMERRISNSTNIKGLSMYSLKYGTPNGSSCFDTSSINGRAQNSGSCIGFAYGTWLDIEGNVSIKLKIDDTPKQCDDLNQNLACNDTKEFKTDCDYYFEDDVPGNDSDINSQVSGIAKICPDTEYNTTLKAKINFKQDGVLTFDNPVLKTFSGGEFTFSTTYTNVASWRYASEPKCPSLSVRYVEEGATYTVTEGDTTIVKQCDGNCNISDCVSESLYYSSECPQNGYRGSKTEEDIVKSIQNKYVKVANDTVSVSLPDSSPLDSSSSYDFNKWTCEVDKSVSEWTENVDITVECKYELPYAWINKKDASIKYTDDMGPNDNYIIKAQTYFTALKQPTGKVNISMTFAELSSIPFLTKWKADYSCDIDCQQKFYDIPNGGYLYYFRPISLSEPFPNGREIGINWVDWISEDSNKERLLETYTTENNLEYTVILTNSDIANIKKYNSNLNYSGGRGYLDYSIDVNGNSDFIKTYSYFTLGNVNHSRLGVFDPEDDMQ